jgi:hypothetical protein
MGYVLGVVLAVAQAVLLSLPAVADDESAELHAATFCSHLAARAYARSSIDPSEKIAASSFYKCECLWRKAVNEIVEKFNKDVSHPPLTEHSAMEVYRESATRHLAVVALDTRAGEKRETISDAKAADDLVQIGRMIDFCQGNPLKINAAGE